MKLVVSFVLLFACLLPAAAIFADVTPCDDPSEKTDAHVRTRLAHDRQGGETVLTAVPIPSVPFTDTGATCDNVNDYDETCPYGSSDSPDVVYSLVLGTSMSVDIDLCGSAYDTKVYVYDEALTLIACNDDFYFDDTCGEYVSRLENVELGPRVTYSIVVDGYGADCGAYVLNVRESAPPCVLVCPPGSRLEGEPALHENYQDTYNGGCCGGGGGFQALWGLENETRNFCGRSGWLVVYGSNYRETDWFTARIGSSGVLEMRGDAEYATYLFQLGPLDCASVGVLQQATVGPCSEGVLTVTGTPGEEVWLWAGPTVFYAPTGEDLLEYSYVLHFTGLASESGLTAVPDGEVFEPTTWSSVKALYR